MITTAYDFNIILMGGCALMQSPESADVTRAFCCHAARIAPSACRPGATPMITAVYDFNNNINNIILMAGCALMQAPASAAVTCAFHCYAACVAPSACRPGVTPHDHSSLRLQNIILVGGCALMQVPASAAVTCAVCCPCCLCCAPCLQARCRSP